MISRSELHSRALDLIVTLPTGEYCEAQAQAFVDAVERYAGRALWPNNQSWGGTPPAREWLAEELTETACDVLALDYHRGQLLKLLQRVRV